MLDIKYINLSSDIKYQLDFLITNSTFFIIFFFFDIKKIR